MILKASQRGGANALAFHLMKDENEHVSIHEMRGFVANDLQGAFRETEAISKGTRCKQYLFSISLNPPETADVSSRVFERTTETIEEKLGLTGQPRAIVFHEKEGRRHAHVVWSRIDANEMKAINLPHFKSKLNTIAKNLYLENGWDLPDGFRDKSLSNPTNFTLAEWQEAARQKRDAREIKQALKRSWDSSDGKRAFQAALRSQGFMLAKGDRRGFVAVDYLGGVYSLSRYAGIKTKTLKDRLGDPEILPSIKEAKDKIREAITPVIERVKEEAQSRHADVAKQYKDKARGMAKRHAKAREDLYAAQKTRFEEDRQIRQARFTKGIRGLLDLVSGKKAALRKQNEVETWEALKRDQHERDEMIFAQLAERRSLQKRVKIARNDYRQDRRSLFKQIGAIMSLDRASIVQSVENEELERQRLEKRIASKGLEGPSFM